LQIRKYLQGELDAKAMHQLERRAQDDPFLMDAIEGYTNAGGDQQDNLMDLSDRLAQRTTEPRRKIVPLWMISAAASVLVVCSVGVWWFYKNNNTNIPPAKQVAANITTPAAPSPVVVPPADSIAKTKSIAATKTPVTTVHHTAPSPVADKPSSNKPVLLNEVALEPPQAVAAAPKVAADKTTPVLKEITLRKAPFQNQVDSSIFVLGKGKIFKKTDTNAPVQVLIGRVQGLSQQVQPRGDINKAITQGYITGPMANQLLTNNDLTNHILAKNSTESFGGYSSNNSELLKATPNNAAELFKKKADSVSKKMAMLSAQYKAMPTSTAIADTTKNAPQASGTDLSEEVVIGYTSQKKDVSDADAIPAHPQKGWSSFKKYLKANAVSPDNKEGVVKLSFMVDRLGSITAIKVIESLSEAADKKAISLVKDGPEWIGNSNKKPEKVHLRIRFIKRS